MLKSKYFKLGRTVLGLVYPLYRSVLAFRSEEVDDDMTWLKYWIILVMVSLLEMMVDPMVDYFPFFLMAKCAVILWCMAPLENNGVSFVFTQASTTHHPP